VIVDLEVLVIIKRAIKYGVDEAPYTKTWWLFKNIQSLMDGDEVDPMFLDQFAKDEDIAWE